MDKIWSDRLTTFMLMMVPIVIGLQPQVMAIIPPEYTIVGTIIFGFISQVTSERRSELLGTSVWMDRFTTLLLMAIPVLISVQPQIMAIIPPEYAILATVVFGVLSQYAAEDRFNDVTPSEAEPINTGQA